MPHRPPERVDDPYTERAVRALLFVLAWRPPPADHEEGAAPSRATPDATHSPTRSRGRRHSTRRRPEPPAA